MNAAVLLMCLSVLVPAVSGFYLFFPQANDRILALEVADQAVERVPNFAPESVLVDQDQAEMTKRTHNEDRASMSRRSADYNCPCLHKVCTYHCMNK